MEIKKIDVRRNKCYAFHGSIGNGRMINLDSRDYDTITNTLHQLLSGHGERRFDVYTTCSGVSVTFHAAKPSELTDARREDVESLMALVEAKLNELVDKLDKAHQEKWTRGKHVQEIAEKVSGLAQQIQAAAQAATGANSRYAQRLAALQAEADAEMKIQVEKIVKENLASAKECYGEEVVAVLLKNLDKIRFVGQSRIFSGGVGAIGYAEVEQILAGLEKEKAAQ